METRRRIKRSGRIARARARRWRIISIVAGILLALVIVLGLLSMVIFQVRDITFSTSSHYTEEELKDLIFTNKACYNSIYLFWKYNIRKDSPQIPFVEKLEVTIKSPSEVKVTTYEKGIVGYMEVLDSYVYFDKDGIVVEISGTLIDNVIRVNGLSTDTVSMGKKLPLEDDAPFKVLLNLSQLMDKHNIHPQEMDYSENDEITLHFGEAKVMLGKDENMDEKIIRLKNIVSSLEGKKGTLHMENVDENTKNMTFNEE